MTVAKDSCDLKKYSSTGAAPNFLSGGPFEDPLRRCQAVDSSQSSESYSESEGPPASSLSDISTATLRAKIEATSLCNQKWFKF